MAYECELSHNTGEATKTVSWAKSAFDTQLSNQMFKEILFVDNQIGLNYGFWNHFPSNRRKFWE